MFDLSTRAGAWLRRGQALEAVGTGEAFQEAIFCYDAAIETLRASPVDRAPDFNRDLGVAWMNRGNAQLKRNTSESLADAVAAYDQAIATLRASRSVENDPDAHNSLGAAWMNRGLALHRQGAPLNLQAAVASHREAIAILRTLPPGKNPWYQRNLAAAHLNLANAFLDEASSPSQFVDSADAARGALALVASEERQDLIAAELALKARRCLCDALGHQLAINESHHLTNEATATETGDTVDHALASIRGWERRGHRHFRWLAARFLRFGTRFYTAHQPQFLAEFLRENLDPQVSPDAFIEVPELLAIAGEGLRTARQKLRRGPRFLDGDPASERLRETCHDLQTASTRLAALAGQSSGATTPAT